MWTTSNSRLGWVAVLTVALTLTFAATAVAFPAAYLTVAPRDPGAGAVATIDVRLPRGSHPPHALALRMARGTKFHDRAVARRCRNAQAARDECPAASRIGGGMASVEASPGGPRTSIDIDMYLAPRRVTDDLTGVVVVTRSQGRTRYAAGRVSELARSRYPKLGLQLRIEGLERVLFGMGLRQLNVHFGVHRTVDGRRRDLLTNPRSCPPGGWPWTIALEARDGTTGFRHGAIHCPS